MSRHTGMTAKERRRRNERQKRARARRAKRRQDEAELRRRDAEAKALADAKREERARLAPRRPAFATKPWHAVMAMCLAVAVPRPGEVDDDEQ